MPGLLGYTCLGIDRERAVRGLCHMAALVTDPETSVWDSPFVDDQVCATRTHLGILQPNPQPHTAGGTRIWFEGELYNGDELRGAASVTAAAHGWEPAFLGELYDHEVCRRVDERGDWRALERLDGIWSAVIYDEPRRLVHLVADRLGMRFLHWTIAEGRLAWATSSSAFLALPGFSPAVPARRVAQFLGVGNLLLDGTWLHGVELVSPGSVLTWDCRALTLSRQRYWWWDRIKRVEGRVDGRAAAAELARRFRRSVERRWQPHERVGLSLSGGLDSRAILAAAPRREHHPVTLTFGQRDSLDARVARRVATIRGAKAHFVEIAESNWLAPRIHGVWWSEGNTNILDLHGMEGRDVYRRLFDINMDGYGGDTFLRGMYLSRRSFLNHFDLGFFTASRHCGYELLDGVEEFAPLGRAEYWILEASTRRWVGAPFLLEIMYMESRKPFLANDVVELVFSLPDEYRFRGRLYSAMLLGEFPEYYKGIVYADTGVPLGWPRGSGRLLRALRRMEPRLTAARNRGVRGRGPVGLTNYPAWLRAASARRQVENLLLDPSALYREYDNSGRAEQAWTDHLHGADRANEIGRYMTVELRLRQLLDGSFRPASAAPSVFARERRRP